MLFKQADVSIPVFDTTKIHAESAVEFYKKLVSSKSIFYFIKMKLKLTILGFLFLSLSAFSQRLKTPTLSPFSKSTQQVGLTEIGLEYARPSAKGRVVFGELVPFNKLWRTGANASTKISLSEAVKIGGNPIEKGTYALYTIPNKNKWTIIIHSNTKMRSIAGDTYKPEFDLFKFDVAPKNNETYIETFTIGFADITSKSFNLQLSWENTIVNIPIEVEVDSKIEKQIAEMMQDSEAVPHRTYFEIAQYYLNNGKDLNTTLNHINTALTKNPKNFRYGLLKAKILHKKGDMKTALKTINESHKWALAAKNANYIEQTSIYKDFLLKN